jgi:hypothetical protein
LPLRFQTEILPVHVRAATAGIFWRQLLQPLVLALLGVFWLGAHLSLLALLPQAPWLMHVLLALLLLGSLSGVAWLASQHYQSLAQENFRRFEGAPVKVSLEEDAYHYQAAWGQGRIPWEQVQSLWRLKEVWVLLQHAQGGVSVLLPAASLDDEAREFLSRRLKAAGAELKP